MRPLGVAYAHRFALGVIMPKTGRRARLLGIMLAVSMVAAPGWADMIRFGYGGSIFGGQSWEIRPDNSVTYTAYQAGVDITRRKDWVWDNKASKAGHIRFEVPQAYQLALAVAVRGIKDAKLRPAPEYASGCMDAGRFVVEVDSPKLTYSASVDACIGTSPGAPRKVMRHYKALMAVTDEITAALKLKDLF